MEIDYQLDVGAANTGSQQTASISYRIYREQAQKPLLVLLHGLASNSTRFTEFVENTSLKQHWDILRMDLRGHGESMYRGYYDRQTWVQDLLQILNHERYPQAVILGHSLGAQVAMEFAVQHPDRTRGLIVIDPIFPDNLHGALGKAKRFRIFIRFLNVVLRLANKIGIKRWHLPKRDLHQLDLATRQQLADNPELKIGDLYTNPLADLKFLPVANYLQDVTAVVAKLPDLSQIKQPTLVLLSKGASISDFDKTKSNIEAIAQSELVIIDADHWLLTEKPEEARLAIESWCQRFQTG